MKLLDDRDFKQIIGNQKVGLFTLQNRNGYVAQFTNYGARWVSMWAQDRDSGWADVVLGFDSLNGYLKASEKYYGAVVGRVCGRIQNGTFRLNGRKYSLSNNDIFGAPVRNHLHGGISGFSFKVWDADKGKNNNHEEYLRLRYLSKDGEEGYPGNLLVTVTYTLRNDNSIQIDYSATTDKATIVNLTNHAYFNLNKKSESNVLNHLVIIHASRVVENTDSLTPTGKLLAVKDTPLDFNRPHTIGSRIGEAYPGQLFPQKGYVVAYLLNQHHQSVQPVATVQEMESGRRVQIFTNQPVLQFYNGWLLDGSDIGKSGCLYRASAGLALETQDYPDAANHPGFPSIQLNPGEVYRRQTIYRFGMIP